MINSFNNRLVLWKVYFSVLASNFQKYGLIWGVKKILHRFLKELCWMFFLPISVSAHVVGCRRLLIRIEHIGHLAAEVDTFIKAKEMGISVKKNRYFFILAPLQQVSNKHLLNSYWCHYLKIITNPLLCGFLEILSRRFFMRYDVSHYVGFFGAQDIYKINSLWGERPPVLQLKNEDEEWACSALSKLGISENQWFVCLHVREGGFLPHNELIQTHRNASIENTFSTMQEIVRRGGIVVRMGDPTMMPLPMMPGVVDYAHHPLKSERMDVVLCAKAKFFLGCTSGLFYLSTIFGVPVAQINMIPVETLGIRPFDISIPKLLWKESLGRFLSFNEIMASEVGGFFFTHQYKDMGISPIENRSEDILMVVQEMLDRLNGNFVESEVDKQLHLRYMSLFKPRHYSYGAASRVCIAFLRKYQHLLQYEELPDQ